MKCSLSQSNDIGGAEINSPVSLPNQFIFASEATLEIIVIQIQNTYIIYKSKNMLKRLLLLFNLLLYTIEKRYTFV